MPDFPELNIGIVSAPSSSPVDAPHEDALIGSTESLDINPNEPLRMDDEAREYFNSVPEDTALNYIMFLHDFHAISFDRLNELKELLTTVPSFLPKES